MEKKVFANDIRVLPPKITKASVGRLSKREHVWAYLANIPFDADFAYRLYYVGRHWNMGRWVVARAREWTRDHHDYVKQTLLKYGFEGVPAGPSDGLGVELFKAEESGFVQTETLELEGCYIYRPVRSDLQYHIIDAGSSFAILKGE